MDGRMTTRRILALRLAEHLSARPIGIPNEIEPVANWLEYSLNRCGLVLATEAGTAETTEIGSVHEGAGRRQRP